MTTEPIPDLVIPELLQGQWSTALISTYGADLNFFETRLLSQLAQIPLRIILADGTRLESTLAESARTGQRHRLANKAYVATSIRHPRAAHAKLIMLLGPDRGLLVVGSGNLGYEGYAAPGELWHVFRYDEDRTQHLNEFAAARTYVDGLSAAGLLDSPADEILHAAWGQATWIPTTPSTATSIRTNLETPLIEQLRQVATSPVKELIAHAPFHDADCAALGELIRLFKPDKVRLLVSKATSADPAKIARVLGTTNARSVEMVQVTSEPGAYIHAKWVHLLHADTETLLTGSANLSRSALLWSRDKGNIELGVISSGSRGAFDALYRHLTIQPVSDPAALDITYQGGADDADDQPDAPSVLWSRLDGRVLTIEFDRVMDEHDLVDLHDYAGRPLTCEVLEIDGSMVRLRLSESAASVVAEGGLLVVSVDDVHVSSTWPFHMAHLRSRLDKAGQREQLPRVGQLPEQDAELFELLQDLDRTLIIDRASVWRIAKPNAEAPPEASDQDHAISLEDLDWSRVRRDPRYSGYFTKGRDQSLPPTDIQIILASIAGKLGDVGVTIDSDDLDDLGLEGDLSSSEPDDAEDAEDELEDELTRRRLPISTRTRMAFDRFIKRYSAALDDTAFIDQLGPIPAARNAVVFNHLLLQLVDREAVTPRWALHAQFKTWTFLWGTQSMPAALASFDDETAALVRQDLKEARARVSTVRGLAAACAIASEPVERSVLRDAIRHMLTDPEFDMTAQTLIEASGSREMAGELLEAITQAAEPTSEAEVFDLVLSPLGLPKGSAEWRSENIQRGSRPYRSDTFVISAPVLGLTPRRAEEILAQAAVASYYAGRGDGTYVRVRFLGNGNAVAYWDVETDSGIVFVDNDVHDVDECEPLWPQWAIKAEELQTALVVSAASRSA